MSDIIAKKYVKAMLESMSDVELSSTLEKLKSIIPLFSDKKFMNIINSYDVSTSQKESLILSMFDDNDEKFTNMIKLISTNKRLTQIPLIVKELSRELSLKKNEYEGVLISNFKVDRNEIEDIEQNLSKKLNADIKLTNKVSEYPGIKVEVDSLGIEVSFSADRLKAQMAEHILNSL